MRPDVTATVGPPHMIRRCNRHFDLTLEQDSFFFALVYGMDGPDGEGYENPEIITGILDYLKK